MGARSILKDLSSRPAPEAQAERLRRASPFAAAAAVAASTELAGHEAPASAPDDRRASAGSDDQSGTGDHPGEAETRPSVEEWGGRPRGRAGSSSPEPDGGKQAGRFAGKGPRRTVSAHLPVALDKRLTRYERERRRNGERIPRNAVVEQAINALPEDLDQLATLLDAHAHLLDLDEATRLLTVRVPVTVAERLDELVDACYLEADLPKVTKRALTVAAVVRLLEEAGVPS